MKRQFFVLAAVIISTQLKAQQDTTQLEEVVTTVSKYERKQIETGKVMTVIDRQQLERNSGRTLPELLNTVAGINIIGANSNTGTNLSTSIRGSSSGNVLILIDGIPVNDPTVNTQYFDINFIVTDQLERIEILKGGQSTHYGSDAVAGVINLITEKELQKGTVVNGHFTAGSFNTLKQHIGLNRRENKINYGIHYTHISAGGFSAAYDSTGSDSCDNDAFNQHSITARLGFPISSIITASIVGTYGYYKTELDAAAFKDDRDFTVTNQHKSITAGLKHRFAKGSVRLNYNFNWLRRFYIDDSSHYVSDFSKYVSSNFIGRTHYAEIYANWKLTNWEILIGSDYRQNTTDQWYWSTGIFGPYAPPKLVATMKQLSPYASVVYKYKKLNVELGGRFNKHSEYGNNFTFTFNPSLRLNTTTKIFANLYSAFKTPSLYQLFDDFAGNPDLLPEEGIVAEAGTEIKKSKIFTTRLVGFYRKTDDVIIYSFNPSNFTSRYINASRQINYGAELEASFTKGPWKINTNYTYTNGKTIAAFDGIGSPLSKDSSYFNLYRIPKHAFNLDAGLQINKVLYLSTQLRSISKREEFIYGASPATLDAYTTIDLYGEYRFSSHIRTFFQLKNITNKQYFDVLGYNARRFNMTAGIAFQR